MTSSHKLGDAKVGVNGVANVIKVGKFIQCCALIGFDTSSSWVRSLQLQ